MLHISDPWNIFANFSLILTMWSDYILSSEIPICPSVRPRAEMWSADTCGDMNAMCSLDIHQPSTCDLTQTTDVSTGLAIVSDPFSAPNLSEDHLNSWNESWWQMHSNVVQHGGKSCLKLCCTSDCCSSRQLTLLSVTAKLQETHSKVSQKCKLNK